MNHTQAVRGVLFPIIYFAVASGYMLAIWWEGPLTPTQVFGAGVSCVGFVFWIVSRIQLGEAYSLRPRVKHLVMEGIYGKIRHPVYVFSSIALAGLIIVSQYYVLFVGLAIVVAVQVMRAKAEEALLSEKFGKTYTAYKRNTWF